MGGGPKDSSGNTVKPRILKLRPRRGLPASYGRMRILELGDKGSNGGLRVKEGLPGRVAVQNSEQPGCNAMGSGFDGACPCKSRLRQFLKYHLDQHAES